MTKILLLALTLLSTSAYAINTSYIGSSETTIKHLYSYSEYGGGDVYFTINNPSTECLSGYWLRKSDPGFNANLSMVIAAYQAKSKVVIYGLPDEPWSGTSGVACRLYSVSYR